MGLGRGAVALLAVAAGIAVVMPASGAEQGFNRPVEILRTSQKRILAKKRLPVRVDAQSKGTLRLYAKRAGGKRKPLTKPRRFRAGTEVARPLLTRAGKRRVKRCGPRNLLARVIYSVESDLFEVAADRKRLTIDRPRCLGGGPGPGPGPDTSTRDYAITPPGDATHTNETPRDLAATNTGPDQVRLALFECGNVTDADPELSFAATGGVADRGSPSGSFSEVEGTATTGSPQEFGPTTAGSGNLDFEITGSDGCAFPVVYRDANSNEELDVDGTGIPTEPYGGGGETTFEPQGVEFQDAGRCDPLDPAVCLQPFPNDHFTVADPSTDTGKRIALQTASMPQSNAGVPVNPTENNRNDGFSPGSMLITKVPGLETPEAFAQTDPVPITDIERSFEEDAPIVVIDATTGERHLIWSELDANPTDPADVNLIIRPAVNFKEGHRYIVALRDLRDPGGNPIEAQRPFQLYRDAIVTSDPAVEARRPEFEELFARLDESGISRDDLYLAWDFTIASERNLTERMLTMRDEALAGLGDTDLADLEVQGNAPTTVVSSVTDYSPCGNDGCQEGLQIADIPVVGPLLDPVTGLVENIVSPLLGMAPEDDRILRKVQGEIVVPCYTNIPLCPTGSQFSYSGAADNIPDKLPGNVTLAAWECLIPRSTVQGGELQEARPSLYGHGLLGAHTEVEAGNVKAMANEHNVVFCATDWAGFAEQDLPTIGLILQDVSNFPKLVDRTQQGMLNFLFLGRAMIHPNGLGSHPAFQFGGESVLARERLFYDGNSQGGILGGALAAVAPDFDRAVLGVPGMNYSTLLRRSVDFEPYAEGEFLEGVPDTGLGLYDRYPNELERPLLIALIQMLWDRGEANGYAHHMTSDPLANTPPHEVLLHVAFGDHQVSMWTAEVEARTIGAATNPFPLDPGRHPDTDPLFGIRRIQAFPYNGSAIIYFDSGPPSAPGLTDGVVPPPTTNTPPTPPEYGGDPHSDPRSAAHARVQKSAFLQIGGQVIDVCGGGPCYADGYTGPP